MPARYVPNRQLARQLRRDPQVRPALRTTADKAAGESRRLARAEAIEGGDYHDGIQASDGTLGGGEQAGRVAGADWKSHLVEFGYTRQGRRYPAKGILRRGAEAAGLDVGPRR